VKYLSYPGDAPLPPDIMVNKAANDSDVIVFWNPVTQDVSGNAIVCDHYQLFEDSTYDYIPYDGLMMHAGPETLFVHDDALIASNHNYLVSSWSIYDQKSGKSNMGYVFSKFLNENAGATADRNWVAMPFNSEYDSVKDMTTDLSLNGSPITKITRLDVTTQNYYSWTYHPILKWYGNDPGYPGGNFTIDPGVAYEVIANTDATVIFCGANMPDYAIPLNENPGPTADRNWVGIPYNAVYDSVKDITNDLAPTGSAISKITRLDETTQNYYSWTHHPILGWYGNDPGYPGNNFPIVLGTGYEFVAKKDTSWNPTEHSNEAVAMMMARRRNSPQSDLVVVAGAGRDAERLPVWTVAKTERRVDYANARVYAPAKERTKAEVVTSERRISHTVYADLDLEGYDNLVFTVYRPDRSYDVLTEQSAGCVMVKQGDTYRLVSFDVGNFRHAWQEGEEVILIIEATKDGRAYFAVETFVLTESDIQALADDIVFAPIPEPTAVKGLVSWNKVDDDNVVGYSLYRDDERINERVIARSDYSVDGAVVLKPVFRGGYETVYDSRGVQGRPGELIPLSYAFDIYPNPFSTQTRIDYALPRQTVVDIKIYDVTGKLVTTVVSEELNPGYYHEIWSGTDNVGRRVSAGVYFVQMNTKGYDTQRKVIFVR